MTRPSHSSRRSIAATVVFSFGCYSAGTPRATDFVDAPPPAATADHADRVRVVDHQDRILREVLVDTARDVQSEALMTTAQQVFDEFVAPACSELVAPRLHEVLADDAVGELGWGGKGVGSQGDGCAQIVTRGANERDILANVARSTEYLTQRLDNDVSSLAPVAEVRKQGLMVGVELHAPADKSLTAGRAARRVCAESVRRGVLLRPLGEVVVISEP